MNTIQEQDIADEQYRIREKYGIQHKTDQEWVGVFGKQFADMYAASLKPGEVPQGEFRKQIIQIVAAGLEALNDLDSRGQN